MVKIRRKKKEIRDMKKTYLQKHINTWKYAL